MHTLTHTHTHTLTQTRTHTHTLTHTHRHTCTHTHTHTQIPGRDCMYTLANAYNSVVSLSFRAKRKASRASQTDSKADFQEELSVTKRVQQILLKSF